MSENESDTGLALTADDAAFTPNPAFTLSSKRRAGSSDCLNCGTTLKGPFCYYCGQPDRNFMRFFPVLLRELLEDFLDLDSRFARTMKPLLFKPGRLTRDYLDGRRFRYTPPMRLYLISSIVFFLFAAFLSSSVIDADRNSPDFDPGLVKISTDSEEDLREVEEVLNQLPPEIREQIKLNAGDALEQPEEEKNWFEEGSIQFNDEPWDRETNPLEVPYLPSGLEEWLNNEIERSPEKAEQINQNPNIIVEQVFDLLPGTMFVLLPVVALIFKFWYLFARRYYIEHLILALHNHAFIFVCLIIALLLELAENWFTVRGYGTGERLTVILNWILGVWIPVYLVVSLRRVYQQGWLLTLGKGLVIGISYLTLLGVVTSVVAVLSFLLL